MMIMRAYVFEYHLTGPHNVFDPATTPRNLLPLVGGKVREALIVANWPDLFRCAGDHESRTGRAAPDFTQALSLSTSKCDLFPRSP